MKYDDMSRDQLLAEVKRLSGNKEQRVPKAGEVWVDDDGCEIAIFKIAGGEVVEARNLDSDEWSEYFYYHLGCYKNYLRDFDLTFGKGAE